MRSTSRVTVLGDRPRRRAISVIECELIDRERFRTRDEARTKIFDYLETWYNPRRRHSSIDYLAPMEYERRWQETLVAPSV